ncbi:aconitase X swivel domain-containing protein [Haliea sp.]
MREFKARRVTGGCANGPALKTSQAINFTGAMCKPANLVPGRKAEIRDNHHELFGKNVKGKVLLFPSAVGSTHTGLVILDLVSRGQGPVAMIVQQADSLLVSGIVLSEVWYGPGIPLLECDDPALFDAVSDGEMVEVDGDAEIIRLA